MLDFGSDGRGFDSHHRRYYYSVPDIFFLMTIFMIFFSILILLIFSRRDSECHFGSGDAQTQSTNDEAELQEQPGQMI